MDANQLLDSVRTIRADEAQTLVDEYRVQARDLLKSTLMKDMMHRIRIMASAGFTETHVSVVHGTPYEENLNRQEAPQYIRLLESLGYKAEYWHLEFMSTYHISWDLDRK